jgi:site-specific DNA-methyltransferase (adenine-specific)
MSWPIIAGDSLDVLPTLEPGSARLIFADPPYNLGIDYGRGKRADRRPPGEYLDWTRQWVDACIPLLTPDGSLWCLVDADWGGRIECVLRDAGLHYRETIIWHETFGVHCETRFGRDHRSLLRFTRDRKRQVFHPDRVPSARLTTYHDRRANPLGRVPSNVWTISRVCGTFGERLKEFPTQLPVELLRRVVTTATDPGDLVVDPFSGSATTGVACLELGRRYLGIEREARFVEASRRRLARVEASIGVA